MLARRRGVEGIWKTRKRNTGFLPLMAHLDEKLKRPALQVSPLSLLCPNLSYGNITLVIYTPKKRS